MLTMDYKIIKKLQEVEDELKDFLAVRQLDIERDLKEICYQNLRITLSKVTHILNHLRTKSEEQDNE